MGRMGLGGGLAVGLGCLGVESSLAASLRPAPPFPFSSPPYSVQWPPPFFAPLSLHGSPCALALPRWFWPEGVEAR